MASLSHLSVSSALPSPIRSLAVGALALIAVAVGLQVMTSEESSFYRTHGMVPDARTAVRLAELVLADPANGCVAAGQPVARLDGAVWTIETESRIGIAPCRVRLDRKDGRILKIETVR